MAIELLLEEARFNHIYEFNKMKEFVQNSNPNTSLYINPKILALRVSKNKQMLLTLKILESFVVDEKDLLKDVVERYNSR